MNIRVLAFWLLLSVPAAAQTPIGTSGATIPLNNTANVKSAEQSWQAAVDFSVRTMIASFTFDATMYKIRANASGGAITGTLPACTAALKGRTYILKKVDSSANAAIYATTGSDTIDGATGATAVQITTQYADVKVTCSDVVGAWDRGD